MMLVAHEHGAPTDGVASATRALQAALDRLAARGGGTLHFAPGTYRTGTLRLPSRVTLHLAAGATLLASPDLADYPPQPYHHAEWGPTTCLLFALGERDIHLEGHGVIDLHGRAFMDLSRAKTGEHFTPAIAAALTPDQFAFTTCVPLARPVQGLFFHDCRAVSFRDLTLVDAPCWAVTLSACEDLAIHGVRIRNHLRAPNSDGFHLCGSRHAVITGCDFVCGDDCLAFTGITDWARPCEHILVADCLLRSHSSAVRLGHLASRVRDVTLRNLHIYDSNRAVSVFAGAGGCVENVSASQLHLHTRLTPGHWWGAGEPLVLCAADAPDAALRDLRFTDVHARAEQGILAFGTAGNITGVELLDWTLELTRGPHRPLLGDTLDLRPAPVRAAPPAPALPWLHADAVGSLVADRIRLHAEPGLDRAPLLTRCPPRSAAHPGGLVIH